MDVLVFTDHYLPGAGSVFSRGRVQNRAETYSD